MPLREYQAELVRRVYQAYREGYRRPCIVLPCGGGKSVIAAEMAKKTTQKRNRVLFLVHRQELCRQIAGTFANYGVDMSLCQIQMVQTAARLVSKLPEPSLILTDENHHCLAGGYRKIYAAFPKAYGAGITATPVRLGGGGLGEVNDKLIVGVSARWLIQHGYLAPYDYYAPQLLDPDALLTRGGEYVLNEIHWKSAIYGDVIRYYRELANGKKAVCYCVSRSHSREMANRFCAAGIPAEHIDGETPQKEREEAVARFRQGETRVLCNVDLISEGFDVPDCGASILLRPTKSLSLYLQQAMRCMRHQPGKRAVIIDHVGNCARFGLPDDGREWSLQPKPGRKKDPEAAPIKECPACCRVIRAALRSCPHCGYLYPEGEGAREIEEIPEQGLVKMEPIVMDYTRPEDCRTIAELSAYARQRGYKPGWVYYQAKARGMAI